VTGDPLVDLLLRHVAIIGFTVVATLLLAVRRRARTLVEAGAITAGEVDRFFRVALVACLLGAVVLWILQDRVPDPACLLAFPPSRHEGWIYWAVFAAFAVGLLAWLWLRDGAELLHRLAPAFSARGRLEHLTGRALRTRLTALVLALPLFVIVLQRILPGWLARC
jgi:uncharacterized membrane protein